MRTTETPSTLSSVIGASIISFVLGYWFAIGRDLFTWRPARLSIDDDDDSSDEDLTDQVPPAKASLLEACKLILVVRTDLGMTKGKVAAQCSHATLACYRAALKVSPNLVRHWIVIGQAKVTVKCNSEEEMLSLQAKAKSLGIVAKSIQDAGRTQIAPGSRTVLGVGPAPTSLVDQVTGHLKLY